MANTKTKTLNKTLICRILKENHTVIGEKN